MIQARVVIIHLDMSSNIIAGIATFITYAAVDVHAA